MASRQLSRSLLRSASYAFRNLSQQAQARSSPLHSPPHRQSTRWRPPAAAAHNTVRETVSDSRTRLLLSYHDLERALRRRGLEFSRTVLAATAVGALGFALAWPRIKQWGAAEGAEVAAASLEQDRLQERAAAMVHEVLSDPRTGEQVEQLLKAAVINLFQDEQFTAKAVEWTSLVLGDALTWESVKEKGAQYVEAVFADDVSRQTARAYLTEAVSTVVADESVQDTVATGLWAGVRASMFGRRTQVSKADAAAAVPAAADSNREREAELPDTSRSSVPEELKEPSSSPVSKATHVPSRGNQEQLEPEG